MEKQEKHATSGQSVTLEELLRLKRRERPDAVFWDDFDRELRQKMLQSLVERVTWRERVATFVGSRFSPVFAATAAAALVVVMSQTVPVAVSEDPAGEVLPVAVTAPVAPVPVAVAAVPALPRHAETQFVANRIAADESSRYKVTVVAADPALRAGEDVRYMPGKMLSAGVAGTVVASVY